MAIILPPKGARSNGLKVLRLHDGIDTALFAYQPAKKPWLAHMPRKNAADVVQVLNLRKFRGALDGCQLGPIDNRPEAEVADLLRACRVFLSFGHPEGCPLPPAEAMACGCVVVGYQGNGGREYFLPEFSYPVAMGDVVGFARAVEDVLRLHRADPAVLQTKGAAASAFIHETHSMEREEQDILRAWHDLLTNL